ncbi:Glucose-repressible alcohol dehydrogenase transcriptional effector [Stygiomarasmius scandens]|uniref:Glucose-repressible alcohol dehydrogenase transcriptional effector n=1 Tax=Marasmiellus scandens TaxID=2682957 RepID=A0ABR1IWK6_9AGAR
MREIRYRASLQGVAQGSHRGSVLFRKQVYGDEGDCDKCAYSLGSTTNGTNDLVKSKFKSSSSLVPAHEIPGTSESNELLRGTNYTPLYQDYIWYSTGNLGVEGVLGDVEKYLEKDVGFPNGYSPSDHICIMSQFRVKPPQEPPVGPPPPTFNS